MCSNYLYITGGEEENQKAFIECFKKMKQQEDIDGLYQFPAEIEETDKNTHSLSSFDFNSDDESKYVTFLSRWSQPYEMLIDLGKHFQVSFKAEYEERADYYGALFYNHTTNMHINIHLNDEDLEAYTYDDDKDEYFFRNEAYKSDSEILDILLTEKIEKNKDLLNQK